MKLSEAKAAQEPHGQMTTEGKKSDENDKTEKTQSLPLMKLATVLVPVLAVGAFYLRSNNVGSDALLKHLALCGSAVVIKLAGSIDDVVWLTPFFCGSQQAKIKSGVVYVVLFLVETCCCSLVTRILAFILGFLVPASAVEAGWDVPCVMQVLSGLALGFYGVKLFREWMAGEEDEDGEDGGDGPRGVKQLIIIGILGSLDDMCVQASLLSSGTFAVGHILVGVFFGCLIVVSICWGASTLTFVLKAMEKIPLWSIVSCLAAYTFASALLGF